jgi:NTP pyrophosphatase (non-canonical NTP hydrolase)
MTDLSSLLPALEKEMSFGREKYGAYHTAHEHYAVLQEEVDEWWQAVKSNMADSCQYELLQVAAVALRYILENCDVEHIEYVQERRIAGAIKD